LSAPQQADEISQKRVPPEPTDRTYDGLLTAAQFVFAFAIIGCFGCVVAAIFFFAMASFESAIVSFALGVGLLINGVIVKGLIRLAINVANDALTLPTGSLR